MKRNCARDNNCQRTDWRVTTERRPQIFIFRTSSVEVTYRPLFISIKQLKLFFCRSHILRLQSSINSYQVTFTKKLNLFKLEKIEKMEGVYQIPWCYVFRPASVCCTHPKAGWNFHMGIQWHLYAKEQDINSVIKWNEGIYLRNIICLNMKPS